MKDHTIKHAKALAVQFVNLAGEVQRDRISGSGSEVTGNALSGALRRLSMDLTRALAEMRKS